MEIKLIGAIIKSISGILVGVFISIILLLDDFGCGWFAFFSILLVYYILFAGVIDIVLAIPATLLLHYLDKALGFMEKIFAALGVADVFENSSSEDFGLMCFRIAGLYMIGLTLSTLLNMLWKKGIIPPVAYLVVGIIVGPLVGFIYWIIFHWWLQASLWTLLIWGLIGGCLGLLASLIPGPPVD